LQVCDQRFAFYSLQFHLMLRGSGASLVVHKVHKRSDKEKGTLADVIVHQVERYQTVQR
jgi:hypothetical protein